MDDNIMVEQGEELEPAAWTEYPDQTYNHHKEDSDEDSDSSNESTIYSGIESELTVAADERQQLPMAQIPQDLVLRLERLECDMRRELGSGGFADVYEGTYRFHGPREPMPVALKVFKNANGPAMRKLIVDEVRTGARVQHAYCIRLFGVVELHDKGLSMVMELARGGSLHDVLDKRE